MKDFSDRYLLIGAGASGLCTANRLIESDIPFHGVEKSNEVGGLWSIPPSEGPLYKNTHLIAPKNLQAFDDFPMPDEYPDYPHHSLVMDYFKSYANHFRLMPHFEFKKEVTHLEPQEHLWKAQFLDGEERIYKGVIIANGHHSYPRIPFACENFSGEILHSKDYHHPKQLSGKRVLIVGSGQSAVDAVVDSCLSADKTYHSFRTPMCCIPRYFLGKPLPDYLFNKRIVPGRKFLLSLVKPLFKKLTKSPARCGLPQYNFDNGLPIPIIGTDIFRCYEKKDVEPKPEIHSFSGNKVLFKDNTSAEIDTIIFATGYSIDIPFLDKKYLIWPENEIAPKMYLHVFHPHYDNLFIIGMIQVVGPHWSLYDRQAQVVAAYIKAQHLNSKQINLVNSLKGHSQPNMIDAFTYRRETEHLISVDWAIYYSVLSDLLQKLGA